MYSFVCKRWATAAKVAGPSCLTSCHCVVVLVIARVLALVLAVVAVVIVSVRAPALPAVVVACHFVVTNTKCVMISGAL